MNSQTKESSTDERQPLFDRTINSYDKDVHQQPQSSRLEWAEASWTRCFHLLIWWWLYPLLSTGYKRTLTEDDIDDLPNEDKCSTLYGRIKNSKWDQETAFKIFFRVFWKRCLFIACLRLPLIFLTIAQPLLVYHLISYIQRHQNSNNTSSESVSHGYFYAIGLFACALCQVLIHHQYYFLSSRLDLRIRNSIIFAVFARLLSINTATLRQVTANYIISIVTNDIAKFEEFTKFLSYSWEGPLEAVIIFGLLCSIIGFWPTLCGYIVFILLIPLQMVLARQFSRYRETVVIYTDQRIHALNELIRGIQVIKMNNWEKYMEARIYQLRQHELVSIRRASVLRALNMGLFFAAIPLIGFATYAGAWFSGRSLKPVEIFICLAFYSQMRLPVLYSLPSAIEKLSEIRLAWRRFHNFIEMTKNQKQSVLNISDNENSEQKGAIMMHAASFSWNGYDDCLSSLDINIKPGTFVGIAGVVGSGKSSFFAALLDEMIQTNGQMNVNGSSFSYAAQSAWIFADTLRANILFNKPFDEQRYRDILRASCLDIDLTVMGSSGDLTVIGENGVNLSGGQRARVCLARALYVDADIYLLDDPLSAVDRIVAKRIYNQCIGPYGLLKNKTRLLITHHTQFLAEADQTIIFTHGHITSQDAFHTLQNESEKVDESKEDKEKEEEPQISAAMLDIGQLAATTQSIIAKETSKNQHVSWSLWYSLLTAPSMGCFGFYFMIILLIIGQVLYDGTNLWLSQSYYLLKHDHYRRYMILIIYFILTMSILFVAVGRSVFFFYQILNGSNRFHNNMLSGVLYTSMRFFESNPSGRIVNRMSKDQQVLDEILPATLFDAAQLLIMTAGSIFVIVIINPWMIILVIVLAPLFWMLCLYYLRSSQQLKRLESVTRSPIYGLFASSINGLATIRVFKVKDDLIHSLLNLVDANTRPYLYMVGASRWFSCGIDLMSTLFTLFPALVAVIIRNEVDPTLLTLSLLYSLMITVWFQRGVRQATEAQNFMTSAERIDEYAHLPPEEDNGGDQRLIKTSNDWPDRGEIRFQNYSLRYRSNLEPTLKNINVIINPAEKVGVIGRTGAGKSSLLQGLLRLVDRSTVDGAIIIDDVDISRITLSHLRSHISVIPQQPVLFAGTLRFNLDPLEIYSDEQCWMALETVRLKQMVSNHPNGLQMPVAESGNNLSIGQCQLICVCRALLRQTRILLIDEATANVDHETDRLLQSLIVDIVKNQTVLTIAHRLNTVTNNDRLLMLENGVIVAFDVPDKVLGRFQ